MAEPILMIALSPTMEEGKILSWKKQVGQAIASGDGLCDVETDKATMEYESTQTGVLLAIVRKEGERAKIGDTIAIIGKEGEDISALLAESGTQTVSGGKSAATSRSTEQKTAAASGGTEAENPSLPTNADSLRVSVTDRADGRDSGVRLKVSPLARKIAEENGIDLFAVRGSGPGGRVVQRDVEERLRRKTPVVPDAAVQQAQGADRTVPISRMRAIIAKRLSESKTNAPHYYLRVAVRMDSLLAARSRVNAELKEEKLSLNAFFIKFAAMALKRHPEVNTSWKGDTLLRFGRADIGLAVALTDGLITPVVRTCESKGIIEIEKELKTLVRKAREGKLLPEEYTDATFTISNLGSFGIEEFTAIINPPGSAILALGEIRKEAVVSENDAVEVRSMMRMTLSCDHRVIDGAVGAAFLKELKAMLENPVRVLL